MRKTRREKQEIHFFADRYDIRYLPPVNFILRVFKSDGTFTDTTLDSALKPQESRLLDL